MIVGFIALGSLSPSDPIATEPSTTTSTTIEEIEPPVDPENFTVAQIATGEPLAWDQVLTSDTGFPIEIVDHFGTLFLFTTEEPSWTDEPGGLIAWESADGVAWERIGQVTSDEYRVTAIASTQQGLLAAGAIPGSDTLTVWRSDDGADWFSSEAPTATSSSYETPVASAIGATSDRIVVAAETEVDRDGIVEDHLEAVGIDVDLSNASWQTRYGGEDGIELSVYGPFVTPAVTVYLDDLDLTDRERRWVADGLEPDGQTSTWVMDDQGQWTRGTVPLEHVTQIIGRNTGGLLALGSGGAASPAGFTSSDGVEWSATADSPTPLKAVNRESFLVGFGGALRPDLLYSMLGGTWREMEINEVLPPSVGTWSPTAFGGGDHGVAMAVEGREEPASPTVGATRGTTTLTSEEGVKLTLDYESGRFMLDEDGTTTHTWEMHYPSSTESPGGLDVDLEDEMIVFRDPHDGEQLATFTFDDMRRAETRFRSSQIEPTLESRHHVLVLNTGALQWEIKDLGPVVGERQIVRLIAVSSDHVVAVLDEVVVPGETPSGFEIWSAPLP